MVLPILQHRCEFIPFVNLFRDKQLTRRDPRDGRAMLVQPTAFARGQFTRLVQVSNAVLDDVFGSLAREEQQALADMVGLVQASLQVQVSPATI